jgi:hypothetical protein
MQEPLDESPCSMAKVARKNREQGQKRRDARVRHHDLGYKGPRGGPLTPRHSMRPTAPLISQGSRVGLTPHLKKVNHSRRRFTPHRDNKVMWEDNQLNKNHPPSHKASQQQLPGTTPHLPQADPLARFKALEGIAYRSKASGATPGGCTHAHPPDSLLKIK